MGGNKPRLRLLDMIIACGIQVQLVGTEEIGGIVLIDATRGVHVQERYIFLGTYLFLMSHILRKPLHVGDHVTTVLTELFWQILEFGWIEYLVLQKGNGQRTEE